MLPSFINPALIISHDLIVHSGKFIPVGYWEGSLMPESLVSIGGVWPPIDPWHQVDENVCFVADGSEIQFPNIRYPERLYNSRLN